MKKSISNLSSVTTAGLDLAKLVFQVHCVDASGHMVVAKAIKRKTLVAFFLLAAALPGRAECMSRLALRALSRPLATSCRAET